MRFGDYGNIYLSIFNHIETELENEGLIVSGNSYGVTLMDAYPDDDQIKKIVYYSDATGASDEIILPVITIEQGNVINLSPFELSSLSKDCTYPVIMSAFLETNIQRLQFETLLDLIINNKEIKYYDYDADFEHPVISGTILVEDYKIMPVQFSNTSPNKFLKWGIDCMFNARRVID